MKLVSISILFAASLNAVHGWRALRRACEDPPEPPEDVIEFRTDGAIPEDIFCLIVEDSDAETDQPLILGQCDLPGQAWKLDNGLFRTMLDQNMCMQAGCHGEDPTHGTQLRLAPCNMEKQRQKFVFGSDIKLMDTNLCVTYRGSAAQDHDPILLKDCDGGENVGWSKD